MNNLYRVGPCIDDVFYEFATCDDMEYALKAKKWLEEHGWEDIEIKEFNLPINTLVTDDAVIDLTI